ncbi:hypothetical protein BJY01DRAFT_203560 [Aspergillus pseudoustus]|uniref:Zn(2)-C6 fungal-type domain-containing protein n=1 Tax=Aspergillus pseudoustus TaxID=1810923 RepID=A0ABR4KUK8_9EURO
MTEKPRPLRFGSTKVRSGCLVCKARRIKCDEARPTCRNCTRSKRRCEYAQPSHDTHMRFVVYTPKASFATTGAQKHSLDFFLAAMRSRFPMHFTQPVLQAAHREDVLSHVVIALGAMQQVYEYDDSSSIGSWSPMTQFAMQQYGKALRLLQDRVMLNTRGTGSTSPDIILISCIFFACFECLRGSVAAAIIHIRSGLNLLREYENHPRTGMLVPKRTMRALFTRLDNQLIEMRGSTLSMTNPNDTFEVIAGDPSPEDDVHDTLNGLWNHILHGMLDSARAVAKGEPSSPSISTPQVNVKENMSRLHSIFERGVPVPGSIPGEDYGQDPDILRIWFLLSPMLLTAHTWDPADAWGPHNDNFARIVTLVEAYLARTQQQTPTRKRTFTLSLGVVPPLCLTATRSRDPAVKQKALYLLSICNRREGIWDSRHAIQIARKTIELDEHVRVDQTSDEEAAATRLKNRAEVFDGVCVDEGEDTGGVEVVPIRPGRI